jgi:hypothetical protein
LPQSSARRRWRRRSARGAAGTRSHVHLSTPGLWHPRPKVPCSPRATSHRQVRKRVVARSLGGRRQRRRWYIGSCAAPASAGGHAVRCSRGLAAMSSPSSACPLAPSSRSRAHPLHGAGGTCMDRCPLLCHARSSASLHGEWNERSALEPVERAGLHRSCRKSACVPTRGLIARTGEHLVGGHLRWHPLRRGHTQRKLGMRAFAHLATLMIMQVHVPATTSVSHTHGPLACPHLGSHGGLW